MCIIVSLRPQVLYIYICTGPQHTRNTQVYSHSQAVGLLKNWADIGTQDIHNKGRWHQAPSLSGVHNLHYHWLTDTTIPAQIMQSLIHLAVLFKVCKKQICTAHWGEIRYSHTGDAVPKNGNSNWDGKDHPSVPQHSTLTTYLSHS